MSTIDQGETVQNIFESKSAPQDKGLEVKLELRLGAGAGTGSLRMTRVAKQCGTSGKDDKQEPRSTGATIADKSNTLRLNNCYIDRER
jgi:hypothetical protein